MNISVSSTDKMSRWNNDQITGFLELYENYENLWNPEMGLYRNRNARIEAMTQFVEELNRIGFNVDADEVRKKIKSIKTVYSEEIRKVEKSEKSGAGSVYQPKLAWFAVADRFLRKVTSTRKSFSNMETFTTVLEDSGAESQERRPTLAIARETPSKSTSRSRPQKRPRTYPFEFVEEARKDLSKIENTVIQNDELDHFGKYVTASLRQLPIINALRCQEKIQNIIIEERIAIMSSPPRPESSPIHIIVDAPIIEQQNSLSPPQ